MPMRDVRSPIFVIHAQAGIPLSFFGSNAALEKRDSGLRGDDGAFYGAGGTIA